MTIEEKINNFIKEKASNCSWNDIEDWEWIGSPLVVSTLHYKSLNIGDSVLQGVVKIIKKGDMVECLTSQSQYIRECKKWMSKNYLQEIWTNVYHLHNNR